MGLKEKIGPSKKAFLKVKPQSPLKSNKFILFYRFCCELNRSNLVQNLISQKKRVYCWVDTNSTPKNVNSSEFTSQHYKVWTPVAWLIWKSKHNILLKTKLANLRFGDFDNFFEIFPLTIHFSHLSNLFYE